MKRLCFRGVCHREARRRSASGDRDRHHRAADAGVSAPAAATVRNVHNMGSAVLPPTTMDVPMHVPAYDWIFLGVGGVPLIVIGRLMSRPGSADA